LIGAIAAVLLLLIAANTHGPEAGSTRLVLELVAIFLLMNGIAIRFWNFAFYTAAVAAGVLLLLDLPHPSDYQANAERVLWTLIGVAIAVVVLLAGTQLSKRAARKRNAQPHPA
jgi:uncharacterized membrane protein YccC